MSGEVIDGTAEDRAERRLIVSDVARTGGSGRTIQGAVERPGRTREASDSAAAAAFSAAVRRFLSGRAACMDARDAIRRAAPWTIVGRLDALGMDGFHRVRMEARNRPMQTFEVTISGHVYQVTVEEVRRPAAPPAVVRPAKGGKAGAAAPGGCAGLPVGRVGPGEDASAGVPESAVLCPYGASRCVVAHPCPLHGHWASVRQGFWGLAETRLGELVGGAVG